MIVAADKDCGIAPRASLPRTVRTSRVCESPWARTPAGATNLISPAQGSCCAPSVRNDLERPNERPVWCIVPTQQDRSRRSSGQRDIGKLVEISKKPQERSRVGPDSVTCHSVGVIDAEGSTTRSSPRLPPRAYREHHA